VRTIGDGSIPAGDVTLRPWRPADVAFVYHACQDEEIHRWTPLPRPYRAHHAVDLLRSSEEGRASNTSALFAITATDTGELLGSIGLKAIDWGERRAEAGYWVAFEARGRGAASSALAALVPWAGDHLGLVEVWLLIATGNTASERAAVRAGFHADGVVAGGCSTATAVHDATVFRRPTGVT
jgi:RimJ/RimL family protein N-acetyltransferase